MVNGSFFCKQLYHFFCFLHSSKGPQSELSDSDSQTFHTLFQTAEHLTPMSSQTRDYGFGYNPEPSLQMGRADDFSSPGNPLGNCRRDSQTMTTSFDCCSGLLHLFNSHVDDSFQVKMCQLANIFLGFKLMLNDAYTCSTTNNVYDFSL